MHYLPLVVLIEVFMTAFLSYIILYTYDRRDSISFGKWAIVVLLLVMMAGMLQSIAYYFMTPKSFLDTIVAVNLSMIEMSFAIILLLWMYSGDKASTGLNRLSINVFAVLLVVNEISMGVLVYALGFGFSFHQDYMTLPGTFFATLSLAVNSYLFIIPMAVEMAVFFILRPVKGTHRLILISLVLLSLLSPTMLGNASSTTLGTLVTLLAMTIILPVVFKSILENDHVSQEKNGNVYHLLIFPILLLMMFSVIFGSFLEYGFSLDWSLFAFSMLLSMGYYFSYSFQGNMENSGNVTTSS